MVAGTGAVGGRGDLVVRIAEARAPAPVSDLPDQSSLAINCFEFSLHYWFPTSHACDRLCQVAFLRVRSARRSHEALGRPAPRTAAGRPLSPALAHS